VSEQAQATLATLEFDLQERAYDELDALAGNPAALKPAGLDEAVVHDLVVDVGIIRHYVFMVIRRDDAARLLRVDAAGYVVKSRS
jgi:hypothetical protein